MQLRNACLVLVLLCAVAPVAHGALPSKSGVRPQVLSLPDGPGSIEGLGESFEPNLSTGSARHSVRLKLPPGRTGTAPAIELNYDSGAGNGVVGLGWQLSSMHVKRQSDKGLPQYGAPGAAADTFVTGSGEELVRVTGTAASATQTFRLKNEGAFSRYIYYKDQDRWMVTQRDGTRFGLGARLDDTDVSARVLHPDLAVGYAWHLAEIQDLNGNQVLYSYTVDQQQVYCDQIRYGFLTTEGPAHTIDFEYQDRDDEFIDYRGAFRLVTAQRLHKVEVRTGGTLVRRYQLDYVADQPLSLLERITFVGSDDTSMLPPAGFTYSGSELLSFSTYQALPGLAGASLLFEGQDPEDYPDKAELIDFNGDALPDLYKTRSELSPPTEFDLAYLNNGADYTRVDLTEQESLGFRIQGERSFVRDVNGDGAADVIAQGGLDPEDLVFRSNERGTWSAATVPLSLPAGVTVETAFTSPTVRCTDLDFDKKVDSLRSYISTGKNGDGVVFSAYMNNGDGTFDVMSQTTDDVIAGVPPVTFEDAGGRLLMADMNGDRLDDLVLLLDDTAVGPKYWPALGMGKFDDVTEGYTLTLTDGPSFGGDTTAIGRLEVVDINGDGLSDLVDISGPVIEYWLNESGVRFGAKQTILLDLSYQPGNSTYRFVDIDGDGLQEVLFYTTFRINPDFIPTGFGYFRLFDDRAGYLTDTVDNDGDGFIDEADEGTRQPNLLTSIDNGASRITSIGYSSSVDEMLRDASVGQPWPQSLPFPVSVVSRVDVNDGLRSYSTEYAYHDGYYDGVEKEFRGFARVDQIDIGDATAPDLVSRMTFDTGATEEARKGKLLQVSAETTSGDVFFTETNQWDTRVLLPGSGGESRSVTYPFQSETLKNVVERNTATPVSQRWEYAYDDFGNVTSVHEHGRLDSGWDDERITTTTFSSAYLSGLIPWILNRPVEQEVTDENQVRIAAQRHYYDLSDTLGVISKANETRLEKWIAPGHWLDAHTTLYDAYGNPQYIRDGLFGSQPGHEAFITYDTTHAIYPEKEDIDTGSTVLTFETQFDYGLGVVTSSEDANDNETTYGYDPFARLTSVVRPGDSVEAPTASYSYELAFDLGDGRRINWVETRQREVAGAGGTIDARVFVDGRGQTVMTRAEGQTAGQIVVTGSVTFNASGMAQREYLPYFASGSLAYADTSVARASVDHEYDALSRPVRRTQPDASFSTIDYLPLARVVKDEEQTDSASIHFGAATRFVEDGLQNSDGSGRLREVAEIVKIGANGEPVAAPIEWLTSYSYDLLDNVTGYTDSQNNGKILQYDGLSRLAFVNDPDRGVMTLLYDDAGNLTQTTDAKGQVNRYEYDGANRLKAEFYDNNTPTPDVEYHYDAPFGAIDQGEFWSPLGSAAIGNAILGRTGSNPAFDLNSDGQIDVADVVSAAAAASTVTARNTAGQLAWVRDQSGQQHNSYDERGRNEWTVKRIADSNATLKNFYSATTYDSMDRVVGMIYPDQSSVSYNYNPRGLLDNIPGVVTSHVYNPAGQVVSYSLANGIDRSYGYDDRYRLDGVVSTRTSDAVALQDLTYVYDDVSNITTIVDNRSNAHLDAIGNDLGLTQARARAYSATQSFTYDSLYRLTQTLNAPVFGTIDYRFDRIGNMTLKDAALVDPLHAMDLGAIGHGGTGGSNGRIGRAAGDPPGPHAPTSAAQTAVPDLAYDDNGNVIVEGGSSYVWDTKDRLVSISTADGTAQYRYDFASMRRHKLVTLNASGASEVYYIDAHSEVRDGTLTKYLSADGNRIARAEGTGAFNPTLFYLHDHLGSGQMATTASGVVAEQVVNYPFGQTRLQDFSTSIRAIDYQFTGKERDQETGWRYFDARYLHGNYNAFTSVDPLDHLQSAILQDPQRLNAYSYVSNNPVARVDPTGEFWGVAAKVVKLAIKGGDIAATVAGAVEDTKTLFSKDASVGERLLAGASLATELFSPVSARDAKAASNAISGMRKGADDLPTSKPQTHHICTNKNCVSTARGGPWTPRYQEIFDKAGLDLDDAINKVDVLGHKGPHPEEYHNYVLDQLKSATAGLKAKTPEFKRAVEGTLDRLATEATTTGSQVNRWLTKK